MKDKKNIVIKVKYPTAKSSDQIAGTTITTWNVRRIAVAAGTLAAVLMAAVYFLGDGQVPEDKPVLSGEAAHVAAGQQAQEIANAGVVPASQPAPPVKAEPIAVTPEPSHKTKDKPALQSPLDAAPQKMVPPSNGKKPALTNSGQLKQAGKKAVVADNKNKVAPQGLNKHVSRAVLTQKLSGKEPGDEITGAIVASNAKPATVFYFTELRNMNGQTVYHEWAQNGKLVARYGLSVAADRWRTSSRRSFSDKSKGAWLVKLTDENHKVLNQKTFNVK